MFDGCGHRWKNPKHLLTMAEPVLNIFFFVSYFT